MLGACSRIARLLRDPAELFGGDAGTTVSFVWADSVGALACDGVGTLGPDTPVSGELVESARCTRGRYIRCPSKILCMQLNLAGRIVSRELENPKSGVRSRVDEVS
jgi:hypothetical protein